MRGEPLGPEVAPREPGLIAEGKTKKVYGNGDGTVTIRSKNALTAGNGAKHINLEGKDVVATATTCSIFELLRAQGLPTHYLARAPGSDIDFVARRLEMIPMEVEVRNLALGSCVNRWEGVTHGDELQQPVVELFDKRDFDGVKDPLMYFDWDASADSWVQYYDPATGLPLGEEHMAMAEFGVSTPETLGRITDLAREAAKVLTWAFGQSGLTLGDIKLEFGYDSETGEIVIGDVIDCDSLRLLDDEGRHFDKQPFRDGTLSDAELLDRYKLVAALSASFITLHYRRPLS